MTKNSQDRHRVNDSEEFFRCHDAAFPRSRIGAIILIMLGVACGAHAAFFATGRVVMLSIGIPDLLVGSYSYRMSLFLLITGRKPIDGAEAFAVIGAASGIIAVCGIAAARNRYRVLTDEQLISSGYFGKMRTYDARAVYRMCRSMSGDTRVLDEAGHTLVRYESNMENAKAFTNALMKCSQNVTMETGRPGPRAVWEEKGNAATRQVSEDLGRVKLTKERAEKVRTVRALLWGQSICSVLLVLVMFFFLNSGKLAISSKVFFGIAQILLMLPLLYPLFFKDIVKWTDPSSGRFANRAQRRNEDKWKRAYVSVIGPMCVSLLAELMVVIEPLSCMFNILKGAGTVWITGILLLVLYPAVLYARTDFSGVSALLLCVLFSACFTWGGTMSLFYCTAAKPVHIPTVAEELRVYSDRRGTTYNATVTLPDGTSRQIELFESVYEAAGRGEKLDLCMKKSILGVEIFTAHEHSE